jgi:hypothetical protein
MLTTLVSLGLGNSVLFCIANQTTGKGVRGEVLEQKVNGDVPGFELTYK